MLPRWGAACCAPTFARRAFASGAGLAAFFLRERIFRLLQADRGGVLAAFAEVGVPEEAGGDGAEGLPRSAHLFEFFGGGAFAELFHFFHGGGECEISDGPDIGAAEGAEEIDVGGPAADAL